MEQRVLLVPIHEGMQALEVLTATVVVHLLVLAELAGLEMEAAPMVEKQLSMVVQAVFVHL